MKQDCVMTRALVQLTETVLPLALLALLVASGRSQAYVGVVSPAGNAVYQAVTPPADVNVSALSRLCFSVTICNNAHVLLANSATPCAPGDPQYEIVIGGWSNTRSVIRAACQGDGLVRVDGDPGPLSCKESRSFYVSWGEGVVRVVGVEEEDDGSVTEHVMMEHHGNDVDPVNFFFVSGWLDTPVGLWRIDFTCQVLEQALTTASSKGVTTASPTGDTTETSEASTSSTDFTPQTTESTSETTKSTSETTESTSETTDFTPQTTESTVHTTKSTSPTTQSTSNTVQSTHLTLTESTGSASDSTNVAIKDREATTVKSTGSPSNPFLCRCLCASNATLASDGEGDRAGLSTLPIAPNSTSMARRRRTSAVDGRVSSTTIGVTGVICVVVPFVLLVFSDITDVVRWVNSKNRRHN